MLIRSVISALIFLSISFTISAQDLIYQPKAQQVDEFGAIQYSDIMARLDATAIQLQDDPTSEMFVIAYRNALIPIGKVIRNFKFMKNYLTRNRGLDPSRLKFIDGGETRAGFAFQIWIVPAGAEAPELLKPVGNSLKNTTIARKFDDDYYAYNDGDEYFDGDTFAEFSEKIKSEPDSIAYVILYPEYIEYGDESEKPVIRKDSLRKTNRVKVDISKRLRKTGLPLSKIKIVNGGYRDYRQVELWILPKGVAPPASMPNQFPKSKGKIGK